MTRGLPAIWSTVSGTPFVVGGVYAYIENPSKNVPKEIGLPILAFGLFVIAVGLFIHFVAAPDPPKMHNEEKIVDTSNPAQRASAAKTVVGFIFLLVTGYLLFFTFMPYVYPVVTFISGLFFFSTGLYSYWTNTLTTYYVTSRRLIKEYRFISLVRQEIPLNKIRGVEERKSVWETMVGLGNVRVAAGGGASLEIVVRNIYSPVDFANEIRDLL